MSRLYNGDHNAPLSLNLNLVLPIGVTPASDKNKFLVDVSLVPQNLQYKTIEVPKSFPKLPSFRSSASKLDASSFDCVRTKTEV